MLCALCHESCLNYFDAWHLALIILMFLFLASSILILSSRSIISMLFNSVPCLIFFDALYLALIILMLCTWCFVSCLNYFDAWHLAWLTCVTKWFFWCFCSFGSMPYCDAVHLASWNLCKTLSAWKFGFSVLYWANSMHGVFNLAKDKSWTLEMKNSNLAKEKSWTLQMRNWNLAKEKSWTSENSSAKFRKILNTEVFGVEMCFENSSV